MNYVQSKTFAVYDDHGRIVRVIAGPYDYLPCDESVRDDTHYVDVDAGEIQPKRPLETHQGVDGLTVTLMGLPAGLAVATNNMETVTDDQPLVIEYDLPGTYTVRFSGHVQYLDHEMEVTVGDA